MFENLFNQGCCCNHIETTTTQSCDCIPAEDAQVVCPNCGLEGTKVSDITINSQIKEERLNTLVSKKNLFNFCSAAKCPVVYYSNDQKEMIKQEEVKNRVSIKDENLDTPLCYCRNLTKRDVIKMIRDDKEEDIAGKIKYMLFNGPCHCEQTNPRGVSCTEDLTIFLLQYGIVYDKNTSVYKEYEIMKKLSSCCGGGTIK